MQMILHKYNMRLLLLIVAFCVLTASQVRGHFSASNPVAPTPDAITCLALNIYFESRNESLAGKIAVGQVVLNRMHSDKFPNDVCAVVREGPISKWHKESMGKDVPIKNRCQFSWYCDGLSDEPKNGNAWQESITIASELLKGTYPDITNNSLWYHADYVAPKWASVHRYVMQIDRHIFYKSENE